METMSGSVPTIPVSVKMLSVMGSLTAHPEMMNLIAVSLGC